MSEIKARLIQEIALLSHRFELMRGKDHKVESSNTEHLSKQSIQDLRRTAKNLKVTMEMYSSVAAVRAQEKTGPLATVRPLIKVI